MPKKPGLADKAAPTLGIGAWKAGADALDGEEHSSPQTAQRLRTWSIKLFVKRPLEEVVGNLAPRRS
jgi:hypothetical protein